MFHLLAGCCAFFQWWQKPVRKVTLLMVGLDNAGKTTAIRGIQGESLEDIMPTVGFSNAHLKEGRFDITLFDVGGGINIRSIWKNYYAEAYGIIFVVDSSDVGRMEETKETMEELLSHPKISGKPMLVLGNKRDEEMSLSAAELVECLSLEKLVNKYKCPCHIESCSAIMGSGKKFDQAIKKGLYWLLENIANNFDTLNERIEVDTAEQKAYEEQQKLERAERVRKIREERERREGIVSVEDDDPGPGNNENPFQPILAVISQNEKQIEDQKKQSLETSQEEHEQMDAQNLSISNSQNTNDNRLETSSSAATELLQCEEKNEQNTPESPDSDNKKNKSRILRLRRCHRVVPESGEDMVPKKPKPPSSLIPIFCGTPKLKRRQLEPLSETDYAGIEREGYKKETPDKKERILSASVEVPGPSETDRPKRQLFRRLWKSTAFSELRPKTQQ